MGEFLSLAAVARFLPSGRLGRPASPSKVFRWIREGVTGADGHRHYLRAMRIGREWQVRSADLDAFLAALQPAERPELVAA